MPRVYWVLVLCHGHLEKEEIAREILVIYEFKDVFLVELQGLPP